MSLKLHFVKQVSLRVCVSLLRRDLATVPPGISQLIMLEIGSKSFSLGKTSSRQRTTIRLDTLYNLSGGGGLVGGAADQRGEACEPRDQQMMRTLRDSPPRFEQTKSIRYVVILYGMI